MIIDQLLSIGKAAKMLGVSIITLRRWEKSGKLNSSSRTFGNHRRYSYQKLHSLLHKKRELKTICYSRVSSHDQKNDLIRQNQKLLNYSESNGYSNIESIMDLGSGLNYKKKGLTRLINMIMQKEISHIIINHKERLLRFGSELLFNICKINKIDVIIIEEKEKDFNQELTENVIELMTVFCAKLYGSRSHKNRIKTI